LAVVALENESEPISIYDVERAITRDLGRRVRWHSVSAVMGADRRFCWSGKGLYGLFRHDLVPGVRTLSGVARVLLAAYDEQLILSDLTFVMKWAGYRFQDSSLEAALHRDVDLGFRFEWSGEPGWAPFIHVVGARDIRREVIRDLAVHDYLLGRWPAEELLDRWRQKVDTGLGERSRRLSAQL
jgi:hypothetical protein